MTPYFFLPIVACGILAWGLVATFTASPSVEAEENVQVEFVCVSMITFGNWWDQLETAVQNFVKDKQVIFVSAAWDAGGNECVTLTYR